MKHWWKIQIYEIQVILYWILGVLILNLGDWHWVGWVSIGYGWFSFLVTIAFAAKHRKEIADLFD